MDNIGEIIGPIIIGVIYVLGSIFNKKDKADETTPEPLQEYDFEAEEQEYQRQVQSRHGTQPITETEPGRKNSPPIPNLSRQQQKAESEGSRDFSWDQSDDSYDNEMEVQLKKIEATKREASRLQSQSQSAQKRTQAKGEIGNSQTTRKKSSFPSVRSSLKDPKAARSAFIYGEVLGPPVSLRKGSGVPGLTS